MKKLYLFYLGSVVLAPIVFLVYLIFDLVCAPRAVLFELVTGALSFSFLSLAYKSKKTILYMVSVGVPLFVVIFTPIIMVGKLGAEKFLNQRLLAYGTFEIFALAQIMLISILIGLNIGKDKNLD